MKLKIHGSVGSKGNNLVPDVKIVQALLNVYLRRNGKKTLRIDGKCDQDTVEAIIQFQKNEQKMTKPDGKVDVHGKTVGVLRGVLVKALKDNQPILKPVKGVVTFDSEGTEGGFYHSRILHVPSGSSGLTLGRGYDMKEKSASKITSDLTKVGIDMAKVNTLAKASGLSGATARQFIIDNDLLDFQISSAVQKELFALTYEEEARNAKRVCGQKRFEEEYGKCDWDKLNGKIKEILVDLKFRGDYTIATAKYFQEYVVNNDLREFIKAMTNRSNWSQVPTDRFNRRKAFFETEAK